jgi:hypothetical protein
MNTSFEMHIINNNECIKEAFGSYAILDQFEVWEQPVIYQFAKIVSNYLKMQSKLEELKSNSGEVKATKSVVNGKKKPLNES